jgi:hypothetical protein
MNFNRTVLAASLLAATNASAITIGSPTNLEVLMSGATAQENALLLAVVDICGADVIVYAQGNQQAATCTLAGVAGGQTLTFRKSGAGGSGNGTNPVFDQTAVPFNTDAAWATCTTTTSTVSTTLSGVKTYDTVSGCTNATTNRVPAAGLADVEPALFGASPGAGDSSVGTAALSFGIIASTVLRDAMQDAQGLTVGSDLVADMPSLSSAELASLLAGNLGLASQLAGAPAVAGNGGAIDLGRRVSTSGTQKTAEVTLLNQGCSAGVAPMLNAGLTAFGGTVTEGSGSSNVRNAVIAANSAGNAAIGILSAETAPTAEFKYLKIDGFSPSIENVINGNYKFYAFNAANKDSSLTGNNLAVVDALIARLSDPNSIVAANTAFAFAPDFQGGFIGGFGAVLAGAFPDARPVSTAQAVANPVFAASKDGFGGAALNNCGSLQLGI